MRIFVAGGRGVIGMRLVPLLVTAGHDVAAMTRRPGNAAELSARGATPIVCDAYDVTGLAAAVTEFAADAVVHQLTDLPDDPAQLVARREANARIREVGTDNLIAAARAAGVTRLVVQSIAWLIDGRRPPSVEHLESQALAAGGVVLRYGQWYGAGTYHPAAPPPPCVHIDTAARLTVDALDLPSGTYEVLDAGIAPVPD